MFFVKRVRPAAVVWTGSVASGLIFGILRPFARLRVATRLPRMMIVASFPLRSLPELQLLSRKVLFVVLVRHCCRTPRSVPRRTSSRLFASFTLVLPSKIVWKWAPFVQSLRERPHLRTLIRFARLSCRFACPRCAAPCFVRLASSAPL